VKSAERTVRIMEALASSPERPTFGRLQELTGCPRSSLYALLGTLAGLKWIEAEDGGESAAYGIGPRALLCGTAYLDRDPALPHAVRQVERLRADVGYTTHYARLDEARVIYLATREATDPRRLTSRVGRQLPAHTTALGKALLAELTDREVDALLPEPLEALTARTVAGRAELAVELDAVRARGWALENEQNTPGVCCVAAAVPYRIPATDAISCAIPQDHASDREVERVARAVLHHREELARTLRREGIR
jgi:DNA-binding IclR family transcriptional regulator